MTDQVTVDMPSGATDGVALREVGIQPRLQRVVIKCQRHPVMNLFRTSSRRLRDDRYTGR